MRPARYLYWLKLLKNKFLFFPSLSWQQRLAQWLICILFLLPGSIVLPARASSDPLTEINLIQPAPAPKLTADPEDFSQLLSNLTAEGWIVRDINSGTVLTEYHSDYLMYPASTTKLMTALVALQTFDPNQVLTVNGNEKTVGHVVGLVPGEQLTAQSLLAATLISSGNDAAFVLANNHPQGYYAFVDDMNRLAEKLHLTETRFSNPSGLDAVELATTPWELSLIAAEILKHPLLKELIGTKQMTITDVTGEISHQLYNTNQLLDNYPDVRGGKTGTTDRAGQVLVTWWEPDHHPVVIVVMGSTDRYQDTKLIIDWLQQHVSWWQIKR